MYDFRDEAVDAIRPNSAKAVADSTVPESWTFRHLVVSRSDNVTIVQFNCLTAANNEVVALLRDDLQQLAEKLERDTKMVLDFSGVDTFQPACCLELYRLSKKLQMKGSRMVLCSLSPSVRESFFTEDGRTVDSGTRK
jgi:anti-anti-sigma regulatory factor